MLKHWIVGFYKSEGGRCPVEEYIDSLDSKSRARIIRTLDLLEELGTQMGMPYTRYLEKQLWELRIRHARNRYRIIYFLTTANNFILLHGFTKKTGPVSRSDIEIAVHRRNDYLSRRK